MKKPLQFVIHIVECDAMQVHASVKKQFDDGLLMTEPDIEDFEGKTYFEAVIVDATIGARMPLQTPFCSTDAERRRQLNELVRAAHQSIMEYVDDEPIISKANGSHSRLHIPG